MSINNKNVLDCVQSNQATPRRAHYHQCHSIHRPRKPYPKNKHEVSVSDDHLTSCRDMANHNFYARQHICYSVYMLSSVRLSVTRVDQSKTVEVIGSCNFHHTQSLQFLRDKFHPETLQVARVGVGKQAFFLASIFRKRQEIRAKLLIGSCIWAFDWHQSRGPWMTLNQMADGRHCFQMFKLACLRLYTTYRHDIWLGRVGFSVSTDLVVQLLAADGHLGYTKWP